MAEALFIATEDLKKNSIINGSVDPDLFVQYISIAQNIHIQNYLGTKLYERLQAGIVANDLTAAEITLIDDYIQDALIHFAAAEYIPFSAFQIRQGGVFKHTSDNAILAERSELQALAKTERGYAEYFTQRMIDFLCANAADYPLYEANTDDDISPDHEIHRSGGWYMDF